MSTPSQNRLVGTIIVTAAIVIFLPGILDGEKESYQSDFDDIPKTPVFTGKMVDKNFPVALKPKDIEVTLSNEIPQDDALILNTAPVNTAKSNKVIGAKATNNKPILNKAVNVAANKKEHKPLPPKAIVNEAWVVQLGSFKNKKNVEQLVTKLRRNGYIVFTKPIKTKKGSLIKVFVGPELIKTSLTKKLEHLKALTGVKGKVVRFHPTK